ncbi:MAG: metallophosphoesterase family protein [archaeon]
MTGGPVDHSGTTPGNVMARLRRPRTDERTRIAVVADPHVSTRESGTSKLFEHTEIHLRQAVADINVRDVDYTLCVGDLTKDGERWNYDAADEILADLESPFRAIPGNHDVYKEGYDHENLPLAEFEARYTPDGLPFHERVGGVDVVGLNCAGGDDWLTDSHDGLVPEAQLDWLDETLAELDTPLIGVHHNLPPMADQLVQHRDANEPKMAIPPTMRDPEPFLDVLDAHEAPLIVTGHLHLPSATTARGVREIMSPTTCSFPQSYLVFDVGPDGTEVRLIPVADHEGMMLGHYERHTDSFTGKGLTDMAAVRLAQFPLVDE